jgi:hypothetical protein
MYTLCIHYTINPDKLKEFKGYVEAEQAPFDEAAAGRLGTFFRQTLQVQRMRPLVSLIFRQWLIRSTTEMLWLTTRTIKRKNVAAVEQGGTIVAMNRSIIQRLEEATSRRGKYRERDDTSRLEPNRRKWLGAAVRFAETRSARTALPYRPR